MEEITESRVLKQHDKNAGDLTANVIGDIIKMTKLIKERRGILEKFR